LLMVDFAADRLERLAAAAAELVTSAFHAEHTSAGVRDPVCREPYCGGFHWDGPPELAYGGGLQPPPPPPLTPPEVPKMKGGKRSSLTPPTAEEAAGEPPEGSLEAGKKAWADRPKDLLTFSHAEWFKNLDPPVARSVWLQPAPHKHSAWWMSDVKLDIAPNERYIRRFVIDNLTPFLRVKADMEIKGRTIKAGAQLTSVQEKDGPVKVLPRLGRKEALRHGKLPMHLTFSTPASADVDFDSKDFAGGSPPLARRPPARWQTLPVKRLDVVLKHADFFEDHQQR